MIICITNWVISKYLFTIYVVHFKGKFPYFVFSKKHCGRSLIKNLENFHLCVLAVVSKPHLFRSNVTTTRNPKSWTIYPVSYTHLDVYKRQTLYRRQYKKFHVDSCYSNEFRGLASMNWLCLLYTSRCV